MKKIYLLLFLCIFFNLRAQNFQLHYDFGEGRDYFTATVEMFKPDEYGATFFFIDFDFDYPGNKSISLAYFEIARYINVYNDFAVTIQYNDGIAAVPIENLGNIGVTLNQTWLAGVSYPVDLGFITLNTELLYRTTYQSDAPDGQFTVVWYKEFFEGKISFTGYLDIWTMDKSLRTGNPADVDEKELAFQTEPQIWYNIDNHLSVGSEVEISSNFLPHQEDIEFMPTVAVKWIF